MLSIPAIPSWDMLHPAIVHFPIALLLVAPIFVLIGIVRKGERGRPFLMAALILMSLGTLSTFVAASTGDAAKESSAQIARSEAAVEQHEELAETAEIAFSALTITFAAILFLPGVLRWTPTWPVTVVLPLVFLLLYAGGVVLLVNTAHRGGMLSHGSPAVAQGASAAAGSAERD